MATWSVEIAHLARHVCFPLAIRVHCLFVDFGGADTGLGPEGSPMASKVVPVKSDLVVAAQSSYNKQRGVAELVIKNIALQLLVESQSALQSSSVT